MRPGCRFAPRCKFATPDCVKATPALREPVAGHKVRIAGRVSMDLIAIDVTGHDVAEGDWLTIDFDLPRAAERSGMSQYELLTGLGARFERVG